MPALCRKGPVFGNSMENYYLCIDMDAKLTYKKAGIYLVVIFLYYLWFQAFYNMVAFDSIYPYGNLSQAMTGFAYNFFPILALFCLNALIVFNLSHRIKLIGLKIVVDLVLSMMATAVVNLVFLVVQTWCFHREGHVDWAGTLLSDTLILLLNEMAYFIMHYRESKFREEQQRHLATRMQYDMLKMQVNPHFLFNSLNILYSLTSIDVEKSREFILSLSQMYRYNLSQQQTQRVKVKEELAFLQSYIDVLSIRYHDCFFVDITGQTEANSQEVIPYCLQLLIENITKHNAIRTQCPMHVSIEVASDSIIVSNPIHPKINAEHEASSGTGLRYLTELYNRYGRQFVAQKVDDRFVAIVPYL